MDNLTLPEPAAGLWAEKRSILHAIPPETFGRSIPPHLGGGTILAARWKHRISTDIDVLLPGRNTLIDLLQDNDRNIVNQLGGTPEAVAAGMVSQQRAAAIESAWRESAGMLADNFHDAIRGARRAVGARLGPEAAAAFRAHRYTRLEIALHGHMLFIRKTIGAGSLEPETYAAQDASRALVESGVATHLNNNGPVTAPQVLAAIRTAVNAGGERTILDSASRSSIDMINRLEQVDPRRPQPTVPGQAQARTRNNDHGYDR